MQHYIKFWPALCLLLTSCALAQWEGNYSLVVENQQECPEGALVISEERVLFGSRLSFDLAPGVVNSQEEECFYSTKTEVETTPEILRITRWTERSSCKDKRFNGTSDESLSLENGTAQYSIHSADSEGKNLEDILCLYRKDI